MELSRHGAMADHGTITVQFEKIDIEWKFNEQIQVKMNKAVSFTSANTSMHIYYSTIKLEELCQMVKTFSKHVGDLDEDSRAVLRPFVAEFINVANGIARR